MHMTVGSKNADKIRKFKLSEPQETYSCPIFRVESREATSLDGALTRPMYTIRCAQWVNVIPVTADGHVVLIEQHRFGTDTITLETPGGAVDPDERDLTLAALRELEEETGLTSQRLLSLPGFAPNPAIQGNRITYFIAFDCQPLAVPRDHHDPFEVIRIRMVPVEEALMMARSGQIQHALAALALLVAEPYLKGRTRA
jgi:8-oxo-dGTP pyrophosphatase MutT (NUDIX family)